MRITPRPLSTSDLGNQRSEREELLERFDPLGAASGDWMPTPLDAIDESWIHPLTGRELPIILHLPPGAPGSLDT